MLLGRIDEGDAAVIVAAITGVVGIAIALIQQWKHLRSVDKKAEGIAHKAAEAASKVDEVGRQIGTANGHGDLHVSISDLHKGQAAIYSLIEEDRMSRIEGQKRSLVVTQTLIDMREAIAKLAEGLAQNSLWQTTHSIDDASSFEELRVTTRKIQTTLESLTRDSPEDP